jgi:tetratricopeptide (TPR) repeat protein
MFSGNCSVLLMEPLLGSAKALEQVQRPREAIPLYRRAVDILEKKEGKKSVMVCVPLRSLGNLLLSIGEVEDAQMYFQRYIIHVNSLSIDFSVFLYT